MKFTLFAVIAAFTLAACGADGEPETPKFSTKTTIGYNSATGAFNKTTIGVEFGH